MNHGFTPERRQRLERAIRRLETLRENAPLREADLLNEIWNDPDSHYLAVGLHGSSQTRWSSQAVNALENHWHTPELAEAIQAIQVRREPAPSPESFSDAQREVLFRHALLFYPEQAEAYFTADQVMWPKMAFWAAINRDLSGWKTQAKTLRTLASRMTDDEWEDILSNIFANLSEQPELMQMLLGEIPDACFKGHTGSLAPWVGSTLNSLIMNSNPSRKTTGRLLMERLHPGSNETAFWQDIQAMGSELIDQLDQTLEGMPITLQKDWFQSAQDFDIAFPVTEARIRATTRKMQISTPSAHRLTGARRHRS